MENPFVYGEAVTGKEFCDREQEREKLINEARNGQKIFLISSRKSGKTSLIKTVLHELKKDTLTVFLDLEAFASYKEFLDAYLSALMQETTALDKIMGFIRQIIPGLRIDLKIDEIGRPLLSLGYEPTAAELNKAALKIFALPETIAKKRKKKMAIVFDEFQEILKLDGGSIEGTLRACIQHQRHVAYFFSGSKQRLLTDMVTSRHRPFYKIGPVMNLGKIPADMFTGFIKSKFHAGGISITDNSIREILKLSENVPYYTQMFCHELWDRCTTKKEVTAKDITNVKQELISQHSQDFYLEWSRMHLSKRQLLKAIAVFGGKSILSKEFLKKSNLGMPSAVRRTLLALIDDGFLDRESADYFFTDILFREWIKQLPA
jgi:hypothetical protein